VLRLVICDWNRTLFEDEYEIEFFRGLAKQAARTFVKNFSFGKLYRLWQARRQCEIMYRVVNGSTKKLSRDTFIKIISVLNRDIFIIPGTHNLIQWPE